MPARLVPALGKVPLGSSCLAGRPSIVSPLTGSISWISPALPNPAEPRCDAASLSPVQNCVAGDTTDVALMIDCISMVLSFRCCPIPLSFSYVPPYWEST